MSKSEPHIEPITGAALHEAYQFVMPSYGWLNTRYDAVNAHIQTMISLVVGFTFSGVALGSVLVTKDNVQPNYLSLWFILAIVAALSAIVVGLVGRRHGAMTLVDIGYDEELIKKEPEDFKAWMVAYAHRHFEKNSNVIRRKSLYADAVGIIMGFEAALLTIWVVVH